MTEKTKKKNANLLPSPFQKIVPESIKAGKDRLLMRLDFYNESIIMQEVGERGGSFKFVSARDIVEALSREMTFATGFLPQNCLWWQSTRQGAIHGIYVEPQVKRLTLVERANQEPRRFDLPLPGLVFACRSGQPPAVWAVKKRPTGPRSQLFHAPFPNVYFDGRSCGGSHSYPADVGEIPESFLISFFNNDVQQGERSKKHGTNVIALWKDLEGQKTYPTNDLVFCTQLDSIISGTSYYGI